MGKHYALSDLHGCYDFLAAIKNYITDDDCVFFLGDAADRGSQGWDCIKSILKDDRFYYLCGNHEDMLRKAMIEYFDDDLDMPASDLLFYNGGGRTYNEWIEEGAAHKYITELEKLPLNHIYKNPNGQTIILTHAGYTPHGNLRHYPMRKSLLWSREHFHDRWFADSWVYVVHGHTPTPHLANDIGDATYDLENGALHYCDGQKICIDTGLVWTGKCVLFDLDTFDSIVFSRDKDGKITNEIRRFEE